MSYFLAEDNDGSIVALSGPYREEGPFVAILTAIVQDDPEKFSHDLEVFRFDPPTGDPWSPLPLWLQGSRPIPSWTWTQNRQFFLHGTLVYGYPGEYTYVPKIEEEA